MPQLTTEKQIFIVEKYIETKSFCKCSETVWINNSSRISM